jgi:hypothetical protein
MYEKMYYIISKMYLVNDMSLHYIVIFAFCDRIYACFG